MKIRQKGIVRSYNVSMSSHKEEEEKSYLLPLRQLGPRDGPTREQQKRGGNTDRGGLFTHTYMKDTREKKKKIKKKRMRKIERWA